MPTRRIAAAVAPRRLRGMLPFAAASLAVAACSSDATGPSPRVTRVTTEIRSSGSASANVVLAWNAAALEAVRVTKPGAPMVARALAVTHTAMYDAWAAYDARAVGTRLGGSLRRPESERTEANKAAAVSYAAYRTLVDLFPAARPTFDALMVDRGYDPAFTSTDPGTAAGVGNAAAAAVLEFRHADGSNQLDGYADYTGYAPVNAPGRVVDPNRWQPLVAEDGRGGLAVQQFVAPHWRHVAPFALTSAAALRPKALPNQYPSRGWDHQVDEVVRLSAALSDKDKMIAEYWAEGPASELPPGHWCLLATWVAERDKQTLDETVKMLFAMSNALLDASIAAWDAKREYDSVSPATAVRFAKAGQVIRAWGGPGKGTVLMRGESWQPYHPAGSLASAAPEFVSGHSAFSAASAEVLKRFTGSDRFGAGVTIATGSSRVEPGLVPARPVTLAWRTFSDAADEAGSSRRFGGAHFAEGDLQGRRIGRQVGALVWAKAQTYFDGTAK